MNKVVNKWILKEQENGVIFWSGEPAILIQDIVIGVTDNVELIKDDKGREFRSIIGHSQQVRDCLADRLTAHLTRRLREAYALNSARLTAQLFTGNQEGSCEATAVASLLAMQGTLPGEQVGVPKTLNLHNSALVRPLEELLV